MFVSLSVFLKTITTASATTAYASTNSDGDCFQTGITDGQDYPFDQETYDGCGDDYYEWYIESCIYLEGNAIDVCERSADE